MKPMKDYSFVKGVNHGIEQDVESLKKHLGYGKRIGLNSIRVWLSYEHYEKDEDGYISLLKDNIRACNEMGYTMVPILFNGNMIDPMILEDEFIPRGEKYVKAVVDALKTEPALIMWDIMNEPPCNRYVIDAPTQEIKDGWYEKTWKFVRHFCKYVKELDRENAITVGNWLSVDMESSADLVDVLSYHDYSTTLAGVIENAERALAVGKKYSKPVINNETCCVARANPYDTVIQAMDERHIPWYVFNLMIKGYWGEVHGIFYEDGTVRDPAIAAACMGCFRNRDLSTIMPEKPNREQQGAISIKRAKELLSDSSEDGFEYGEINVEALLTVSEEMANLLEAGQVVAMQVPPTARINAWRKMDKYDYNTVNDIKRFTYSLVKMLQDGCQIV